MTEFDFYEELNGKEQDDGEVTEKAKENIRGWLEDIIDAGINEL